MEEKKIIVEFNLVEAVKLISILNGAIVETERMYPGTSIPSMQVELLTNMKQKVKDSMKDSYKEVL